MNSFQKNGEEERKTKETCKRALIKTLTCNGSLFPRKVSNGKKNILLIFSKLKERSENFFDAREVLVWLWKLFLRTMRISAHKFHVKTENFLYEL